MIDLQRILIAAFQAAARSAILQQTNGLTIAAAGAQDDDIVVMTSSGSLYLLTIQRARVEANPILEAAP